MEKFPTFKQGDSPKKLLEHTLLNNMFSALEGQVTRTLGVDSIRAGNSDYTPIPGGPSEVRLVRVVDYEAFSGSETFSAPLGEVNVIQCELIDALFAEEVGTQEVSQQSAKPNVIYAAAPPSFTTEVDAFIWVVKFSGQWWVLTGGGGGGSIIMFKVTDSDESGSGCVTATVELIPCGGADVAVGDEITVQDEAGCMFNIDPILLLGGYGFATKMQTTAMCDPYDTAECQWVVLHMCCQAGCP